MKLIVRRAMLAGAVMVVVAQFGGAVLAAGQEKLTFRLEKEKTHHAKDDKQAKSYEASLKKLGCEVRLQSHGDHQDVIYSCPKWREADFPDHATAHKWEVFLKALGFEVKHEH